MIFPDYFQVCCQLYNSPFFPYYCSFKTSLILIHYFKFNPTRFPVLLSFLFHILFPVSFTYYFHCKICNPLPFVKFCVSSSSFLPFLHKFNHPFPSYFQLTLLSFYFLYQLLFLLILFSFFFLFYCFLFLLSFFIDFKLFPVFYCLVSFCYCHLLQHHLKSKCACLEYLIHNALQSSNDKISYAQA